MVYPSNKGESSVIEEVIAVTITSNQVSPVVDKPDVEQRPGSSDIAWAERAYHHRRKEPANEHRRASRARPPRLRIVVATLAVICLMAGLIVATRFVGSSPSPVVQRSTSSQTAAAPQSTTSRSSFTLTPPPLSPFPSLSPTIDTPTR